MNVDASESTRLAIRATKVQRGLVAAAALLLPVILGALVAWNGGVADPAKFAHGLGRLVVTYSVIVLIAWLVYLASRRRSLWPGVATFVILMTLFSASVGVGMFRGFQKAAAARERAAQKTQLDTLTTEVDGIKRSMRESLGDKNAAGDPHAWKQAGDDGINKLDEVAAGLSGDTAIATKAMVSVAKRLSSLQSEYLQRLDLYSADGGLDASSLKTKAMVSRRRALLRDATQRQKSVVEFLHAQDQHLFRACVELGMNAKDAASVRRGAAEGLAKSPVLKLQALETEALETQDKYLETLERHWGHWSVVGDLIEFDEKVNTKDTAVFNALLDRMQAIDVEQQALQKAVLDSGTPQNK